MLFCVVLLLLPALLLALLLRSWFALLPPLYKTIPPIVTGTLALIAFWSAFAVESADCCVFDDWPFTCAWPAPPQPIVQLELLDWFWLLFWVVLLLLLALLLALLSMAGTALAEQPGECLVAQHQLELAPLPHVRAALAATAYR